METVTAKETKTSGTKNIRRNARCKTCGAAHSTTVAMAWTKIALDTPTGVKTTHSEYVLPNQTIPEHFVCCGRKWRYSEVKGIFRRDVECNSKCTGSKGHTCECSCGGANHGASHG